MAEKQRVAGGGGGTDRRLEVSSRQKKPGRAEEDTAGLRSRIRVLRFGDCTGKDLDWIIGELRRKKTR
jgi:hypothetical protein